MYVYVNKIIKLNSADEVPFGTNENFKNECQALNLTAKHEIAEYD